MCVREERETHRASQQTFGECQVSANGLVMWAVNRIGYRFNDHDSSRFAFLTSHSSIYLFMGGISPLQWMDGWMINKVRVILDFCWLAKLLLLLSTWPLSLSLSLFVSQFAVMHRYLFLISSAFFLFFSSLFMGTSKLQFSFACLIRLDYLTRGQNAGEMSGMFIFTTCNSLTNPSKLLCKAFLLFLRRKLLNYAIARIE